MVGIANLIKVIACIVLMIGFQFGLRWALASAGKDFTEGCAVGVVVTLAGLWLVKKIDPSVKL
jgi:hypothetical protein